MKSIIGEIILLPRLLMNRNELDILLGGPPDLCLCILSNLDARLPVLHNYVASDIRLSLASTGTDAVQTAGGNVVAPDVRAATS